MYCEPCQSANKDNVLAVGTDNFRTSTLTRHVKQHPDHQFLLLGNSMQKSTKKAIEKTTGKETRAVNTAMKALYYIAKEYLPLSKYTSLISLFRSIMLTI